jgi:tRNA (guanine37-N1)-methyltransferase
MLEINIITLFPNLFEEFKNVLPFNRAIKNNLVKLNIINLRDYAIDSRGTVDDKPYGGGTGMVLRPEPLFNALNDLNNKDIVIALTPKGEIFNQSIARDLSQKKSITIICGRYEGIDQRIIDNYTNKEISLGNFVCSGGEAPAITILESVIRILPGILEEEAISKESHTEKNLEHPQYTRPEDFKGHKVPEVLLSGNHSQVEKWKLENSKSY